MAYAPYPHRAVVKVEASVEGVDDRIPPTVGTLEAIDERTCLLHTWDNAISARFIPKRIQNRDGLELK